MKRKWLTDGGSRFIEFGQDAIVLLNLGHNSLDIVATSRAGATSDATDATDAGTTDAGGAGTDARLRVALGHVEI